MSVTPSRGEIWDVDFDPTKGHEQAGRRPALIVSDDILNHGPAGLVVVVPLTTKNKNQPLHVTINPPEGGVTKTSFIKCEDIRSVTKERLFSHRGTATANTMTQVEDRLRVLLQL